MIGTTLGTGRIVLAAGIACLAFTLTAPAAVMSIDSVTLSPTFPGTVDDDADVTEITVASTNYVVDDTATFDVSGNASNWFTSENGSVPSGSLQNDQEDAAASGPRITDGVLNVDDGSFFNFSRDVASSDWIFITELNGDDEVTIKPTDAGTAIGTWTLDIAASDWGELFDLNTDLNPGLQSPDPRTIDGVAFQLSDFTGDTGPLTGVDGIEIDDANGLDAAAVGLAVIPEPATLALLGLGGAMILAGRRRA